MGFGMSHRMRVWNKWYAPAEWCAARFYSETDEHHRISTDTPSLMQIASDAYKQSYTRNTPISTMHRPVRLYLHGVGGTRLEVIMFCGQNINYGWAALCAVNSSSVETQVYLIDFKAKNTGSKIASAEERYDL